MISLYDMPLNEVAKELLKGEWVLNSVDNNISDHPSVKIAGVYYFSAMVWKCNVESLLHVALNRDGDPVATWLDDFFCLDSDDDLTETSEVIELNYCFLNRESTYAHSPEIVELKRKIAPDGDLVKKLVEDYKTLHPSVRMSDRTQYVFKVDLFDFGKGGHIQLPEPKWVATQNNCCRNSDGGYSMFITRTDNNGDRAYLHSITSAIREFVIEGGVIVDIDWSNLTAYDRLTFAVKALYEDATNSVDGKHTIYTMKDESEYHYFELDGAWWMLKSSVITDSLYCEDGSFSEFTWTYNFDVRSGDGPLVSYNGRVYNIDGTNGVEIGESGLPLTEYDNSNIKSVTFDIDGRTLELSSAGLLAETVEDIVLCKLAQRSGLNMAVTVGMNYISSNGMDGISEHEEVYTFANSNSRIDGAPRMTIGSLTASDVSPFPSMVAVDLSSDIVSTDWSDIPTGFGNYASLDDLSKCVKTIEDVPVVKEEFFTERFRR